MRGCFSSNDWYRTSGTSVPLFQSPALHSLILVGGIYRVLVWGEGCLNGAESTELSLLRSRQLREHFIAMNANTGTTQQSSETSAGNLVSPQDLTPMEWFYLCSMGCRFPAGAGYSLILQRKTISSFMWINEKLFLISGW
jgi:hypothetical protein